MPFLRKCSATGTLKNCHTARVMVPWRLLSEGDECLKIVFMGVKQIKVTALPDQRAI